MPIKQHQPRIQRRCKIRGWLPIIFCEPRAPFFRPFKILGKLNQDRSGGWTIGELTLQNFYLENKAFRNIWGQSNCGFDLARYFGTHLTLYPTEETDYIFWYDTDYGNFNEFKTLVQHIHPAILINRPHTTVVLSKKTRGIYRSKKVFIPPPTVFQNEWAQMSNWAERGLAVFAVSTIDFTTPWIHPHFNIDGPLDYDLWDYSSTTGRSISKVISKGTNIAIASMWWNKQGDTGPVWATNWPGWSAEYGSLDSTTYPAVALGPFVVKKQDRECQIIFTYRSLWKWGGDILTLDEKICNPKTGEPKSLFKQLNDPKLCIGKDDIDKSGYIKPEKWRELTDEPREKSGISAMHGTTEGEEEDKSETSTDDTLQIEDEEESSDSDTERPRRSRRGLDGGRIAELLRLRYIIRQLKTQKSWSI